MTPSWSRWARGGGVDKLRASISAYAKRYRDNACAAFGLTTAVVDDGKSVRCWRVEYVPRPKRKKVPSFAESIAPGSARVHLLKDDDEPRRGPGRPRKVEGRAYK